ncbi:MAG: hypothetical protein Q8L41_10880 [Anaerolineales bacterium]|nr:hypothetical protein [Anaerolineales bacterium]
MSNHSKTLVPLESWSYNSPEIRYRGNSVDIGLMAEALIYYDQVFLNITNQPQLAEFINWFVAQKKYADLLALFRDETIKLYDYSFATAAFLDAASNSYMIMNMQDPIQEKPNTFEQRFLYHESLNSCFRNSRDRIKLYKALRGKVVEIKAKDFGHSIENARQDYLDPRRSALLLQALVDEAYPSLGLGTPPTVTATIETLPGFNRTIYNIDFENIKRLLGVNLNFHGGTPLTGIAHCNRLIWSAAQEKCDLYLGNPMANLVGDKLYESRLKNTKIKENIGQLNQEVEFPNIRKLVNEGKLDLSEILKIRKKAKRFRDWLQSESDRDRNTIIAYHNEVAKEAGIVSLGRKTLRMFGILGIPLAEAFIAKAYPETVLMTGSISAGAVYLIDVASKIGEDWKPVVFGNWVRDRIEKVLKE